VVAQGFILASFDLHRRTIGSMGHCSPSRTPWRQSPNSDSTSSKLTLRCHAQDTEHTKQQAPINPSKRILMAPHRTSNKRFHAIPVPEAFLSRGCTPPQIPTDKCTPILDIQEAAQLGPYPSCPAAIPQSIKFPGWSKRDSSNLQHINALQFWGSSCNLEPGQVEWHLFWS
jgi:hypothetical protein